MKDYEQTTMGWLVRDGDKVLGHWPSITEAREAVGDPPAHTRCPRCDNSIYPNPDEPFEVQSEFVSLGWYPPALSRFDNKTNICSACGMDEALLDLARVPLTGPDEWPVERRTEANAISQTLTDARRKA